MRKMLAGFADLDYSYPYTDQFFNPALRQR
jgi:hypothetical protein